MHDQTTLKKLINPKGLDSLRNKHCICRYILRYPK